MDEVKSQETESQKQLIRDCDELESRRVAEDEVRFVQKAEQHTDGSAWSYFSIFNQFNLIISL